MLIHIGKKALGLNVSNVLALDLNNCICFKMYLYGIIAFNVPEMLWRFIQ